MYYPHFGLKEPPFKITPNTDFFFSGGNRGAVLDALVYAITNGEGIIKVVGEVGSGKTMLCRMLQTILPDKIESIYLANPSVAPEDVLHAIAFELQLKLPKNADRLKVMQVLQSHLLNRHAEGRQVVIFVEEAQGMPLATLEEIRLLSNLETKQDKLLQIVLFGQPELDANLSEPHIRQLRERITHSFHLEPLGTKDIGDYLISRLRAAGYHGPHLFSDSSVKKLSVAAKGLARRVNILADKSLLAAFADNAYQVTPKHVKAAIQDSEFGRNSKNYKHYFIGAILLIACLTAILGYTWWKKQPPPKTSINITNSQTEVISSKLPTQKSEVTVNLDKTASVETNAGNTSSENNPTAIAKTETQTAIIPAEATPTSVASTTNQTLAKNAGQPVQPASPPVETIVTTAPLPAKVAATAITSKAPEKPAELPIEPQLTLLNKRLAVTKKLLLDSPPSTITLQIKSLPTDEKMKAELDRLSQQLEIDNIYLYQKTQNNVLYTIMLYGEFAQRSEALTALQNLPTSIKNNKPYLRTFAGINKDIEQTQ